MHEYDAVLKILLQASGDAVLGQIIGGIHVSHWLNSELPQVQSRRADLLGVTIENQLVHIELQSSNDPDMALRMAEYAFLFIEDIESSPSRSCSTSEKRRCAWLHL